MNTKVSVIVPVYNVEKYIDKCLQSLLAQTYKNIEIMLIDDGSPDRCPRICDDYAAKNRQVRAIHQKNTGVAGARKCGLENATGDKVAFVDPDDWILPSMIEEMAAAAEEHAADIVVCDWSTFSNGEENGETYTQTLKNDLYQTILTICGIPNRNGGSSTSDTGNAVIFRDGWELPMVWGVGASYNWANMLTIGFDYERQCMASALYNGLRGDDPYNGLQDRSRYAFGVEYRHNPMGRKYAERMLWRAGVSVQNEYLSVIGATRITAGIGIGFPLYTIGTIINTTIEYTHRGSSAGLEEHALRFTIGASIAENWFFKRKL